MQGLPCTVVLLHTLYFSQPQCRGYQADHLDRQSIYRLQTSDLTIAQTVLAATPAAIGRLPED